METTEYWLRQRLDALIEEWEHTTVPARLAFLVAADELRDALAGDML